MGTTAVQELDKVVIKFAGDSGDGMQLTGTQFTGTSALLGNDIATFPDYPAEIRAPQGTVAGVSGFQVHIGQTHIYTPGDQPDVLVAMNAAALKANINEVPRGKTIIVDIDNFTRKDWEKAGYDEDPLKSDQVKNYHVIKAPITTLTQNALEKLELDNKSVKRSKNMFALGMVYMMFSRPLDYTERFLKDKFAAKKEIYEANVSALKAGYYYADTIEALSSAYTILPADMEAGQYKNVMGNEATAWGFLAAAEKAGKELFLGSYPITPASEILHEISKYKHFGAKAFQAEDEIAGIVSTIGASFAGDLAITTTSGPGLALKGEALGLAVMAELPIVVVDVQRGGPSTGLPTKTEQSDLLQALYGRNGESPVIVVAAKSPSHCFDMAFEASKLALEHVTPVILLTDGYVANGSQPWKIKKMKDLPAITPHEADKNMINWQPYERDANTLARYMVYPGMKGYEHRIGGLEKDSLSGDVSHDPKNHQKMVKIREEKVQRAVSSVPDLEVEGVEEGELLVVGWGGTYGSLTTAIKQCETMKRSVAHAHFTHLKPLPKNTAEIFSRYKKILICELNNGQLIKYLRGELPQFEYMQFNKIQGLPFRVTELTEEFKKQLGV
ncbi:MAG: 2-oxoacid:acceptor oxidoreductase subunit alpha [Bacteroidota bacterium]